jgi:hypothetical protein
LHNLFVEFLHHAHDVVPDFLYVRRRRSREDLSGTPFGVECLNGERA